MADKIIKIVFKKLCPPLILDIYRKLILRQKEIVLFDYQGVKPPFYMSRLHNTKFSHIHEKWANLDTHINRDSNVTRLRVYIICQFAKLTLNNTNSGAFLTAGVSFGTSALITSEYLNLENFERDYYLIDPFDGSTTAAVKGVNSYNTDFDLVKSRWNNKISTFWIRNFLSLKIIQDIPALAFVHLNTGDFESELNCISILYQKLIPGGFIILDIYGWLSLEKQKAIDSILDKIGATSFMCISRQLVISK